jgi:hypothetical protein
MIQFLYFSLMQLLENVGPMFPNSDHALETGLVTSVKEGWNFVARPLFGNTQDLDGKSQWAICEGLPTACNRRCSPNGTLFAMANVVHITIFSGYGWKRRCQIHLGLVQALAIAPNNGWIACTVLVLIELFDLSKGSTRVAVLNDRFEAEQLRHSSNDRKVVTNCGTLTLPANGPPMPLSAETDL